MRFTIPELLAMRTRAREIVEVLGLPLSPAPLGMAGCPPREGLGYAAPPPRNPESGDMVLVHTGDKVFSYVIGRVGEDRITYQSIHVTGQPWMSGARQVPPVRHEVRSMERHRWTVLIDALAARKGTNVLLSYIWKRGVVAPKAA